MAYGARLESVLGASPRGFESPILRHQSGTVRFRIFFMPYLLPLFPVRTTPPISAHSRPCFLSTTPPHTKPAAAYHAAPCDVGNKNPATHCMTGISGGSAGIRTRGGLHHTAFRVLHLRPLGHATSAAQFTGDYSQYANFTYPAALTQKCTPQTRHAGSDSGADDVGP